MKDCLIILGLGPMVIDTATGELVDGVWVIEAEGDQFSVKVD